MDGMANHVLFYSRKTYYAINAQYIVLMIKKEYYRKISITKVLLMTVHVQKNLH